MQTITITGRVGGEAETRDTGGTPVTNFNCAVDQGWGDKKTTNWFRVAIWGKQGTALQPYIKKGEKVAVTGELSIGEYNGKPQYEIRAHDIDPFMQAKGGDKMAQTQRQPAPAGDIDHEDEEIPF